MTANDNPHNRFNAFDKNFSGPLQEILNKSAPGTTGLKPLIESIISHYGLQAAYNVLMRAEVAMGIRKPTLAIYDNTGHIIGGGQKYGFTVAHALQDIFSVTLLFNKTIGHKELLNWYQLDLSACQIKIIPIPFFDQFDDKVHLDPARVNHRTGNPFHVISKESGNYDFFINNSMNEKVYPLANLSFLICHFPERRPRDFFYADQYHYIIYNSKYTAHWIEKKWKLTPHQHIYPPVDMAPTKGESPVKKERIIISVARFEMGGSKKQWEMVQSFIKLNQRFPEHFNQWQLVLAGGSVEDNPYLQRINDTITANRVTNILLKVNISGDELQAFYKKASIFWHLCGLDQSDPALVEHFGMTIAEAMQNSIVPIVFDGGGQKEIVEQGITGFRVNTTADLMKYTLRLVQDEKEREQLALNARVRSHEFCRETFEKKVTGFFGGILEQYRDLTVTK